MDNTNTLSSSGKASSGDAGVVASESAHPLCVSHIPTAPNHCPEFPRRSGWFGTLSARLADLIQELTLAPLHLHGGFGVGLLLCESLSITAARTPSNSSKGNPSFARSDPRLGRLF